MRAIEFETTIRNGLIHVPPHFKNMKNTEAKVIVMVSEGIEECNYDKSSLLKLLSKANKIGLFNDIVESVSWQKLQRNEWE
jgi:hypothetical protein